MTTHIMPNKQLVAKCAIGMINARRNLQKVVYCYVDTDGRTFATLKEAKAFHA